jgi:glycyl-tRNA synthetase
VHAKKTGAPLVVRQTRSEPLHIEEWEIDLNKKKFGPRFKQDGKTVETAVMALTQEMREKLHLELEKEGKISVAVPAVADGKVELDKELVTIEKRKRVEHTREFTPNVIEPSFGIGRILYCLMEHVYWSREGADERGVSFPPALCAAARTVADSKSQVLSFPPIIAPTKVLLVPLSNHADFRPLVNRLGQRLRQMGVSNRTDDSGASIGKRYSRNDELGTPLGVTVDFQSVKDNTFTLRDRDTTSQVRADEDKICEAIKSLTDGVKTWADIQKELPAFTGQEVD